MATNIPIRLIHNNGDITQILATDVALDVERKTGGIAVPGTGSTRVGFDFNMNNSTIIINGIITDDEVMNIVSDAAGAVCKFDFSVARHSLLDQFNGTYSWISDDISAQLLSNLADSAAVENATNSLELIAADGSIYNIWLVDYNGTTANRYGLDGGSSRHWIAIRNSSSGARATHAEIADNLTDLINSDSTLQTKFHATLGNSSFTGETNVVVNITQLTKGSTGNTASPIFHSGHWAAAQVYVPWHQTFRGGKGRTAGASGLSAGDKVMNLFGILNNSENATFGSRVASIFVSDEKEKAITDQYFGDYIIGIQIPYNSTYHAGGAEKYNARNFFMPTGASYLPFGKSTGNSEVASIEFDPNGGDTTGIKGTVQKATFTQLGGEPIWSYTIVFAPIDLIW